jgi:hypothetical protein
MPARTMTSDEARSNWRKLLEGALSGDTDTIVERFGQPVGALIPFADYVAILEALEDLRVVRQAISAVKEWEIDPSTARPWREVFAELGVDTNALTDAERRRSSIWQRSNQYMLDSHSTMAGTEGIAPPAARSAGQAGKSL